MRHSVGCIAGGVVLLALAACTPGPGEPDELADKQPYTILQSFEIFYRDAPNAQHLIPAPLAMKSEFDVLGVARCDRPRGYVWLVTNAADRSRVLVVGTDSFSLSANELDTIRQRLRVDPVVARYLAAHMGTGPDCRTAPAE